MASSGRREVQPGASNPIADALERLYGAPLEQFVPLRKEIAGALRAAGDPAASRQVAAAVKPSRTAWALNQVARRRPDLVRAALEARASAADAATARDPQRVRATARSYRDRIAEVIQAANEALAGELSAAQGRRIGETLQAIAGQADADAREALLAGRLVGDLEMSDPFAGLAFDASDGPSSGRPAKRAREPLRDSVYEQRALERDRALREAQELEQRARAVEAARERVTKLEAELREARAAARSAEVAAMRAQDAAARARRSVIDLESRIAEAKEAVVRARE